MAETDGGKEFQRFYEAALNIGMREDHARFFARARWKERYAKDRHPSWPSGRSAMADAVHIDWTEGPWVVVPANEAEHRWVVGMEDGTSIASCEPMGPWISPGEADEIADLIASAPALKARVAVLEDLVRAALPIMEGAFVRTKPSAVQEFNNAWCLKARAALKQGENDG